MRNILKNDGVKTFIASIICILCGLFLGFIVLLFIEPSGALTAIVNIIKNFFYYSRTDLQLKYLGHTLVKTAPLVMCSLSVLFAYKVGLFNIGVAGQYVVGACACLYAALVLGWSWIFCMLFAGLSGALYGALGGLLKAFKNVNEVISGIMLNWIALYATNMILSNPNAKNASSPYTYDISVKGQNAKLPSAGLESFFNDNIYITIAIPLAIIVAVLIWVILEKTKLGFELKATGLNKHAAKYCGMHEKRNIIVSLAVSGLLAGLGASFFYLTDFEQWKVTSSTIPHICFDGIAGAFLGGLNPIGAIFSSLFIQHITDGGSNVDLSIYCSQISGLISSIIIYLCGFVGFLKMVIDNAGKRNMKGEK